MTLEHPMREIQQIWDTIYGSRPHKFWTAAGRRTLALYKESDLETPAVELNVNNETDRCTIRGAFDEGHRCPGLSALLGRLLEAAAKRERGTN